MSKMRLPIWLSLIFLVACGGSNPEIWVEIQEPMDLSYPCLGASHLQIRVVLPDGTYKYDQFGRYFADNDYRCIVPPYSFADLPLADGVRLELVMTDSSTDAGGELSSGISQVFNVSADSPTTKVVISLQRTSAALGTAVLAVAPADWTQQPNLARLRFSLVEGENGRAGYFYWVPAEDADPFPLFISGLPVPGDLRAHHLVLEGLDANDSVVKTWETDIMMGGGSLIGYANF
ncbi:MAG: hypothetical protein JRF33_10690 [Deltaproteobacteria bacterium]|nr:hypothetical protein [Deltaproteobacteria bacterium]